MTTSLKTASKRRWDSKPGVKRSQFWSHSPSSATALGQLDAVFRPVGFPESPPKPGMPVVPAPGSPTSPVRTAVIVHPVAGHGVGKAVPR
jgi:hypothetical protein